MSPLDLTRRERVTDVPPEEYGSARWSAALDNHVTQLRRLVPSDTPIDDLEAYADNEMWAWEDTRDCYALGFCKAHNAPVTFIERRVKRSHDIVRSWPCACYHAITTLRAITVWRRERKRTMTPERRAALYRFLGRAERVLTP